MLRPYSSINWAEMFQKEVVERRRTLLLSAIRARSMSSRQVVRVLTALGRKEEAEEIDKEILRLRTEIRKAKSAACLVRL